MGQEMIQTVERRQDVTNNDLTGHVFQLTALGVPRSQWGPGGAQGSLWKWGAELMCRRPWWPELTGPNRGKLPMRAWKRCHASTHPGRGCSRRWGACVWRTAPSHGLSCVEGWEAEHSACPIGRRGRLTTERHWPEHSEGPQRGDSQPETSIGLELLPNPEPRPRWIKLFQSNVAVPKLKIYRQTKIPRTSE